MTLNRHCIAWDDISEERAPTGVAKRVLPGEGASLVMMRVPAGTKAGRHSHPYEQFVQVIAGSGTLETEQGQRLFGPGQVFHFPAGAWHAASFDSDTVLIETNLQL
ncbi:Cupin 2 conserved barrel domain protein [Methylobacterium sp. 4-46]|uniref:cupin domain-containing protein n=1 Tax=unclassified Methylobacterium TaxID=2615210 RepID=UPI000152D49B|nr:MULTISPECIES: cupin domain-containing protein [Methylobacterium]ACA21095.1 Cupin 2 conserved barrel domain protein [Methylobacterium sp. 4-46]WFT80244.1 cupin domain-containing protein [Methylobacterium nodulans]